MIKNGVGDFYDEHCKFEIPVSNPLQCKKHNSNVSSSISHWFSDQIRCKLLKCKAAHREITYPVGFF